MRIIGKCIAFSLVLAGPIHAQTGRFGPDDVATPRALTLALHEWASTTSEESLEIDDLFFLMDQDAAAVLLENLDAEGRPERRLLRTWFQNLDRVDPAGWLETVLDVQIQRQGRSANAWAQYEVRNVAGGPVIRRGITNLQMYSDGNRWWGLGWVDVPMQDE